MPFILLIVLEIILLIVICFLAWQVWHHLNKESIPDNEPLDKSCTQYLIKRLNILRICIVLLTIMLLFTAILSFIRSLS